MAQAALMGGATFNLDTQRFCRESNSSIEVKGGAMGSSDKPSATRTPATLQNIEGATGVLDKAVVDLGNAEVGFILICIIDVPAGQEFPL